MMQAVYNLKIIMSEVAAGSLLEGYFNLHPSDALEQVRGWSSFLAAFVEAFKERIEAEIDYSRALLKVGRMLARYVTPAQPSPISFVASAFQVEHEQRARHALQLAEYLHSEVEVPCVRHLQATEEDLGKAERQLRGFYRQGEAVEEAYQKQLKRYYRTHQEWEERMIAKNILTLTPGATQPQKEKAATRLEEDRRENEQHRQRYLQALEAFNSFANRYNQAIGGVLGRLEEAELAGLTLQADSMRKLIVSEINMFKNIEYDLLNISRQMEIVKPNAQIEAFVAAEGDRFNAPIISIYAEGPVANRYDAIDLKTPICGTLLEETLKRIDNGVFYWLLDNKTNSTLRYAIEQLLQKHEATPETERAEVENELMADLEGSIASSKSVRLMPMEARAGEKQQMLRPEVAVPSCLELVGAVGHLLRGEQEHRDALLQLVEGLLAVHHIYRFVLYAALNAHQDAHDQRVTGTHYPLLLKILIQRSLAAKDVFVARLTLTLLFSVAFLEERPLFCFQFAGISALDCWQSRDFWEAALFESTVEACALLPAVEKSFLKEVFLMRQKNVVFSAMATYCHYMVMLGEEVQEVKTVMARFAHFYNLTEEHEHDLGKSIAVSIRQLREMQE